MYKIDFNKYVLLIFRKPLSASRIRLPAQSSRRGHDEDRVREPTEIASIHKALFGDRKKPFHGMSAVPYASSGHGSSSSTSRSAAPQKFTVVMPSGGGRRDRR